jgi:hypothetical protein
MCGPLVIYSLHENRFICAWGRNFSSIDSNKEFITHTLANMQVLCSVVYIWIPEIGEAGGAYTGTGTGRVGNCPCVYPRSSLFVFVPNIHTSAKRALY